jgi:hypothetical protein
MRTALLAKLLKTLEAAAALDLALWTDAFKSPETRAIAEAAMERTTDTADRIRFALAARYDFDVRYLGLTASLELLRGMLAR